MKELFQKIETLIPTLPGWSEVEKVQRIAALVVSIRAETSVEIGVYAGRSFMGMALAHKWLVNGSAVAIDPWDNAAASDGYEGQNKIFWKNNPLEQIYQGFLKTLDETETKGRVHVWRKKSDDVTPPSRIDVLSIDGQHTEQAIRDVQRFSVNVRRGGFCVMDDITWENDGKQHVKQAVEELIRIGFEQLYPLGTGAVFQRV